MHPPDQLLHLLLCQQMLRSLHVIRGGDVEAVEREAGERRRQVTEGDR